MAELRSVWLQEQTWEDVDEYLKVDDIVIFPVGSTEEHGPAAPLGVDSFAAINLAEDAAKEAGVLVTPPLWFGDSPHHMGFPGTISLRTETLVEVTKDVLSSLFKHGFKKFIVINGHKSSNIAGLTTAMRSLHENEMLEAVLCLVDPMFLAKGIAHIKDNIEHHAGELEVSHTWYKHPHLIKAEKLALTYHVDLEPILSPFVNADLLGKSGKDHIEIFWNSKEQKIFAPNGSFSDARQSSPEKGKTYHEYMVKNLVSFIHWLRQYQGPIGKSSSKI